MILPSLAATTGLAVLGYNYLSGRNLIADSWDQFKLVTPPLE